MATHSRSAWDDTRVWEAMVDWRWVPPSARRFTTDRFDLIVTPGSYNMTTVYGFLVQDPEKVDAALDEVETLARSNHATGARFQVLPTSRPLDLGERLLRRGYSALDEVEVLVYDFHDESGRTRVPDFHPPAGVLAREARNDEDYSAFVGLNAPLWDSPEPPPETRTGLEAEFRKRLADTRHSGRYVVWKESTPIGHGGLEVVGRVARFWGSGILPAYRNLGAYSALVLARCEEAVRQGAEIALVTARIDTSGPILKRHGFRVVGPISNFEVRWPEG
jgi:GNAT superfamily N-acetyltransferase